MVLLETVERLGSYANGMGWNAIMNGNFDVWQRGTSFTSPANASYTADRWCMSLGADGGTLPTVTHTKQKISVVGGSVPNSFYCYRIAPNGAGTSLGNNAAYGIFQWIENGVRYLCGTGKKITISFYAKASVNGRKIGVRPVQYYGTGGSPSSQDIITGQVATLTTDWARYSLVFDTVDISTKTFGNNNDDALRPFFEIYWGSTRNSNYGGIATTALSNETIDITQVQVCAGSEALPFFPKTFAEEYQDCLRYFQKSFPYTTTPANALATTGAAYKVTDRTGAYQQLFCPFSIPMRIAPTIATYTPLITTVNRIVDINTTTNNYACYSLMSGEKGFSIETSSSIPVQVAIACHWTASADF